MAGDTTTQQQRADQNSNDNDNPRKNNGITSYATHVLSELGLVALWRSQRDVKLLCLQRFVRLFAYGGSTLVLVAFLQAVGISRTGVGLFMTLTLAGDVCISFLLTLFADALGRRAVLVLGAALMAASGVVFASVSPSPSDSTDGGGGGGVFSASFSNYCILLAAAVFGVISPSGNEIGPFRAVEESVVAHLTSSADRSDVYAWYSLSGTAGTAVGMMVTGWVVHGLVESAGWELVHAYHAVFAGYAVLGLVKLVLAVLLSSDVESEERTRKKEERRRQQQQGRSEDETTPLLRENGNGNGNNNVVPAKPQAKGIRALLPEISKESRLVIVNLCFLFALDAFASGLAPFAWVIYFFRSRFNLEEGRLGSVFFATSTISALSMLVASSLAKRFGNVNTMVFTHLPSAVFLALIPVPGDVHFALLFLVLRACTQSMDVAPRSAFLAAIVLPGERTAVMGLVNVVKTLAQSLGPAITGVLADRSLFWVAFVCAGSLKASYDLGLLALFRSHEREKAERAREVGRREEGGSSG